MFINEIYFPGLRIKSSDSRLVTMAGSELTIVILLEKSDRIITKFVDDAISLHFSLVFIVVIVSSGS